jgi:exodeoxyribonuclease V beta subunit
MSTARKETAFDLYGNQLEPGIYSIEASAGTGKTYTLAQLVVRLVVEEGIALPEILVVTFTRAAAAELRQRIYQRLNEVQQLALGHSAEESKDPELKQWLDRQDARALDLAIRKAKLQLDQAAIFTIDSFASKLVREHALALGMPWDAQLQPDMAAQDQYIVDALWHGLDALPEDLVAAILQSWSSPESLCKGFQTLGEDAQFSSAADWQALLQERQEQLGEWNAEKLKPLGEVLEEAVEQGFRTNSRGKCRRMIVDPLLAGQFPRMEDDDTLWAYLQKGFTKKHPLEEISPVVLAGLRQLDQCLASVANLETIARSWFQQQYQSWRDKRQQFLQAQGAYTYNSLKRAATEAVEQNAALRKALQSQFQACLIDEFQDTDPWQWRLFRALFAEGENAEGEKKAHRLFLIGDPKQAIYSFRGANLETYFSAVAAADYRHRLNTNYRSHPQLIAGFNALFAEIGKEDNEDETSTFGDPRCRYTPVAAGCAAEKTAFSLRGKPAEKIRLVRGQAGGDADKMEESALRQLVVDVVEALKHGKVAGQAVKPGDIAVLTKSNAQAQAIQKALRRAQVPSVLTSRSSVWVSDSCADLLQLLQGVLEPRYSQQLRRVLAGPYFHCTQAQLDDPDAYSEAQLRFAEAQGQWQKNGVLAAVLDLFEQAEVWPRLATLADGDRRIADTRHLLELLQEEAAEHGHSPQSLLRWALQKHQQASGEDSTLRLESDDDAVEIVTIHSAKGLEYPLVFVFGAWKDINNKLSTPVALQTADGTRASFDEAEKNELKRQLRLELRRLFYVACTRAQSHLSIYWPQKTESKEKKSKSDGNKQSPLHWIVEPRLERLEGHPVFCIEDFSAEGPLPGWQPAAAPAELVKPTTPRYEAIPHRVLSSYSALARQGHEDTPWAWKMDESGPSAAVADGLPAGPVFGQLVHDFLEHTDFTQPDWALLDTLWQRYGYGEQAPLALRAMLRHTVSGDCMPFQLSGLPPENIWKESHFVLHAPQVDSRALDNLLGHRPDWTPLPATRLQGYLQGFIDLIVEHEGRYYVLDYKSNRLERYDQDAMADAMASHHYTLQALIYTLALDRHLRHLLPGYDPAIHLGGARYLFVRGMREGRRDGVYAIDFDPAIVQQAQAILNGEQP